MSYSNLEQSSLTSGGALSLTSSDPTLSFSQLMEGYDHEFVPQLDSKYECPICLLVVREPRQTKCGHRFCRDCIMRSLRDAGPRCPVDNEPLKESEVYPDNLAKREVLNFTIRCPNAKEGCSKTFPLGKLQNHLEECLYALTPCPNKCSCIMQRIDMNDHITKTCENRIVSCQHCQSNILMKFMEKHAAVCPNAVLACPHCHERIARNELNNHIQSDCQLVEVHCPFLSMGCDHTMVRSSVDNHLIAACSRHMKQLCHAVSVISYRLGINHFISEDMLKNVPEALSTMLPDVNFASSMATLTPYEDSHYPEEHSMGAATGMSLPVHPTMADPVNGKSIRSISMENGKTPSHISSYDDGLNRITIAHHHHHQLSIPAGASNMPLSQTSDLFIDQARNTMQSPQTPKAKLPVRRLIHQPVYASPSSDLINPEPKNPTHIQPDYLAAASNHPNSVMFKLIEKISSTFQSREVINEQRFCELYNKLSLAEQRNTELTNKVRELEQRLVEHDGRFFYGDFYWSITNFSAYQAKVTAGESSTVHSPPFYTSPWGYKMCVRACIEKNSDKGPHLSLFVHFMQSHNDSFLTWPFSGKITICVVDQNPDPSCKRMDMKETLQAYPNFTAFQRPTIPKSQKGIGYVEFLSLAALENGTYLVDDTLVIRILVVDDSK